MCKERELIAVMEKHATVVFIKVALCGTWRKTVANKYSNLPGIRELHDIWH